ncbi:hypothetical protein M378DRAFT_382591 [Amanita muscaria Koide BX008]|uniref:ATP-citrate synthase citrate-binding domain-containing protein n=1 Tax=Amanita muscaria (strain Koide BX008) TaxID=946122 RepID=A0A0C2WLA4_AMAMK|nr:hypothetical protein M378DRAFT_382591 [Amanita muscaria Koide BX008]
MTRAAIFKGIVRALKEYTGPLIAHSVKIFVGPDYQEGLQAMRLLGESFSRLGQDRSLRLFFLPLTSKSQEERRTGFEVLTGHRFIHHPLACVSAVEQPPGSTNVSAPNPNGEHTQHGDQIIHFQAPARVARPPFGPLDENTRFFLYRMECSTPITPVMSNSQRRRHDLSFWRSLLGYPKSYWAGYTSMEEAVVKHRSPYRLYKNSTSSQNQQHSSRPSQTSVVKSYSMPACISDLFKEDIGVGRVVTLLWCKRRITLRINGIESKALVSKDLVSSFGFGLLATSSRFNDTLDEVATIFSNAGGAGMTLGPSRIRGGRLIN